MTYPQVQGDFSADDFERLARSRVWKTNPQFVESMCRLFYEVDPGGCFCGVNPHALTEYLREVEMVSERLSEIGSELDLSMALHAIFEEMFEGQPSSCDWAELAKAAWPIATARRRL